MDKPVHQVGPGVCLGRGFVSGAVQRFVSLLPRSRHALLVGLIGLLTVFAGAGAIAARYVYDGNGRLVVVTNEGGQSARYVYDKLGNLLRIERLAADQLAVFSFAPTRGGVGLPITIQGQGFSPTPSQNQVAFNGTAATVTSATATELVAQVPAGATTGPLTVTVGTQTATGPVDFVVDENAQPPVITDVSPLVVSAGTAVTVTGERLYPAPDQSKVSLNGRLVVPTALANTELTFPVPIKTGSGRVTVSTPYGWADSDQTVIVAPSGVNPADIVAAGTLIADGPAQSLSASAANQQVALLIDGEGGLMSSLQFSNLSTTVNYTLYGPTNAVVQSGSVSGTSPTVHLPKLTAATYLLLMKPGVVPASWNVALERNQRVAVDGESLPVVTQVARQSRRLVFTVAQGANLGLGLSELVTPGANWDMFVDIYTPSGSRLTYGYCNAQYSGCDFNLSNLAAGEYTVVILPPENGSQTMSFKATLSSDVTGTLQPDVPADLALPRPGQHARLSFAGQAGQTVALRVGAPTTVPAGRNVIVEIYRPDGSLLQSSTSPGGQTFNLANLPASGMYTVRVNPYWASTLTAQVTLVTGVVGTLEVDGATQAFATQTPGQRIYLKFTAAQGANLGLGLSELVTPGANWDMFVDIYTPSGSRLTYGYCNAQYSGCDFNLSNLAAGEYTVVILPPENGSQTMSFKATLYSEV